MKYFLLVSSIFIVIPLFAIWKWIHREDRGRFPFIGVTWCCLIPIFFVIYGLYGPFYSIVEPVGVTNAKEYFDLLSKEERPIKWVLFVGFIGQFFLNGWVWTTAKEGQGFLLVSFSLLGIYSSIFTVLFAADSLFLGGLG